MTFKRSERVKELLRHEISLLVQEIKDPRIGFVTITGVDLSDDLTDAKVYYSVLGSEEDREVSTGILHKAVPSFRKQLGRKLESLYRVPALLFRYDETPAKAERVISILNQLTEEQNEERAQQPEENTALEEPSIEPKPKVRKKKKF